MKNKKTNHQLTVEEGSKHYNDYTNKLPHDVVPLIFKGCPFCGNSPIVFQVPEKRYGESSPLSWNLECPNMGCMFSRPETGDQSLEHLAECWNVRADLVGLKTPIKN